MTGSSAIVLGAVIGLMIAFDMGGPVNKTAFLVGHRSDRHQQRGYGHGRGGDPGDALGQGLATLLRRKLYTQQERDTGIAALFMGFFGISEGAIPFGGGATGAGHPGEHAGWSGRRRHRGPRGGRGLGTARRADRRRVHGDRRCGHVLRGDRRGRARHCPGHEPLLKLKASRQSAKQEKQAGPVSMPHPATAPGPGAATVGASAAAKGSVSATQVTASAPAPTAATAEPEPQPEPEPEPEVLSGYLTEQTGEAAAGRARQGGRHP